eukprot:ctg_225.g84
MIPWPICVPAGRPPGANRATCARAPCSAPHCPSATPPPVQGPHTRCSAPGSPPTARRSVGSRRAIARTVRACAAPLAPPRHSGCLQSCGDTAGWCAAPVGAPVALSWTRPWRTGTRTATTPRRWPRRAAPERPAVDSPREYRADKRVAVTGGAQGWCCGRQQAGWDRCAGHGSVGGGARNYSTVMAQNATDGRSGEGTSWAVPQRASPALPPWRRCPSAPPRSVADRPPKHRSPWPPRASRSISTDSATTTASTPTSPSRPTLRPAIHLPILSTATPFVFLHGGADRCVLGLRLRVSACRGGLPGSRGRGAWREVIDPGKINGRGPFPSGGLSRCRCSALLLHLVAQSAESTRIVHCTEPPTRSPMWAVGGVCGARRTAWPGDARKATCANSCRSTAARDGPSSRRRHRRFMRVEWTATVGCRQDDERADFVLQEARTPQQIWQASIVYSEAFALTEMRRACVAALGAPWMAPLMNPNGVLVAADGATATLLPVDDGKKARWRCGAVAAVGLVEVSLERPERMLPTLVPPRDATMNAAVMQDLLGKRTDADMSTGLDGTPHSSATRSRYAPTEALPRRPYVANLAVLSRYRRRGIARQLLQACEQQALAWGYAHIYLHVEETNAAARALYGSAGYTEISRAKHPYKIPQAILLFLTKALTTSGAATAEAYPTEDGGDAARPGLPLR